MAGASLLQPALGPFHLPSWGGRLLMSMLVCLSQEDDIAQDFNDQSVIENYSLRQALRMINHRRFDFLSGLVTGVRARGQEDLMTAETVARKLRHDFRSVIINCVLGSDMSRHFEILDSFNALVLSDATLMALPGGGARWIGMNEAQRGVTIQMALKVLLWPRPCRHPPTQPAH